MALKHWDGFDHYNGLADFQARSGFTQYQSGTLSFQTGRNGNGLCLLAPGWSAIFASAFAQGFMGIAAYTPVTNFSFSFRDTQGGQNQVVVTFNQSNFSITIARGDGTVLLQTANNVWTADVWNFIEINPLIATSTGGSVTVRINDTQVAQVTGVNTQYTANTNFDRIDFSGFGGVLWDDFYFCDTTTGAGTNPCNTFLGDPRVYSQFPTANDVVQFTPLASTNVSQVQEVAMDSDTTYNSDSTVGHQDTFTVAALPGSVGFIFGVAVTGAFRKDDAGPRSIKQVMKSGGTTQFGTTKALPDSQYFYLTDLWILDPNTTANWTAANVNAAKPGYNLAV